MDDDDVRQVEIDGDGTKELLQSFDAARGGADAADRNLSHEGGRLG